MTIKFDRSAVSGVLITCTRCPHWYAFRFEQGDAYRAGESHATRVHDEEPVRAAAARLLWEKRHAAHS